MENEACNNKKQLKSVAKIDGLLFEIETMAIVVNERKPVDVNMQQYSSLLKLN